MAKNMQNKIIQLIRDEPLAAHQIAEELRTSVQYVRNTLSDMEPLGIIKRIKSKRNVLYSVTDTYVRDVPMLINPVNKRFMKLEGIIPSVGTQTKAAKASNLVPEIAVRLLMIGYKYETLRLNIDPDTNAYRNQLKGLRKEMRELKVETEEAFNSMQNTFNVITQLKEDEEFWKLDKLSNNFTNLVDEHGNVVPPTDLYAVTEAHEQILANQTEKGVEEQ